MARQVYALVLAAGQARRMGRLKQLLPFGEGTMLDAVIDAVLESPLDGMVIVANGQVTEVIEGRLPERCFVTLNDEARSEMIDSVRIGLDCLEQKLKPDSADGVMILLADQPQVSAGVIATCAETVRLPRKPPEVLIPTYHGRRGHPTIFLISRLKEIELWPADKKLSDLTHDHPEIVRELPITLCPMPIDVNTPEDYARLMESL
jgi:molybdenum cofactor cytidylyltransferase